VAKLLADPENDTLEIERSHLYDGPEEVEDVAASGSGDEAVIEATSDVDEMKDAE
jgi:hypothetical protein